jgi:alpha-galactosidase
VVNLEYNGGRVLLSTKDLPFTNGLDQEGIKVSLSFEEERIWGEISQKKGDIVERVELEFEIKGEFTFFKNGFQSWSPSCEVKGNLREPKVLIKSLRLHWDDPGYLEEVPYFSRSHFFTYLKGQDGYLFLEARDLPIPLVHFLFQGKKLKVVSEICKSGPISFPFLDLKIERFTSLKPGSRREKRVFGWTSWYYYFQRVRPEDVEFNLDLSRKFPFPLDYFQIDDGWERAIGDWEENEKFRGKLGGLAQKIRDKGYKAGIWLAPFIVEKRAENFRKREWLLKGKEGKPLVAGFNPVWGGHFFALDPTHPEVQEYLKERISYFRGLGFDFFKMDYLYSLALPGTRFKENLSRREAIGVGLEILRSACGSGEILGCGGPLLNSTIYNFLRIGPDTADCWENKIIRLAGHIGGVEAKGSLSNTINRFFLDGKWWNSDPDVLILRKGKMSPQQRRTLILSNFFLSRFHFYSDPLDRVPKETLKLLEELKAYQDFVLNEGIPGDFFTFRGECAGKEILGFINLEALPHSLNIPPGYREIFSQGKGETLLPFQTRIFSREKGAAEG